MIDPELMQMANRIEALAFQMKAPNAYTPQFVMLANELRARLPKPDVCKRCEAYKPLIAALEKELSRYRSGEIR
jgi:hypothetical protein